MIKFFKLYIILVFTILPSISSGQESFFFELSSDQYFSSSIFCWDYTDGDYTPSNYIKDNWIEQKRTTFGGWGTNILFFLANDSRIKPGISFGVQTLLSYQPAQFEVGGFTSYDIYTLQVLADIYLLKLLGIHFHAQPGLGLGWNNIETGYEGKKIKDSDYLGSFKIMASLIMDPISLDPYIGFIQTFGDNNIYVKIYGIGLSTYFDFDDL